MKNIKKVFAVVLAASVILSVAACNKQPTESQINPSDPMAQTIDLSGKSIENVYGSQLYGYLEHQYYFDGQEIPKAESNFYFTYSFNDLNQLAMYGMCAATAEGFVDLSAPWQNEEGSNYATTGDFFVEYAERMMESTLAINKMAEEEGLTLSAETEQQIEDTITSLTDNYATPAGISIEEYLQIYYGPSCTVEVFRNIVRHYKMADLYTLQYIDEYEFTDEEIMAPNIRYVVISAPEGSDEATLSAAEAKANEILAASSDIDQLEVQGALAYTNGEALESSTIVVDPSANLVSEFVDWANDESREVGDMDVIYAPRFGYFVMGYVGTAEVSDTTKEDIAIKALGDFVTAQIEDGVFEMHTDDVITPAQPVIVETDPVTGAIITPAPEGTASSVPARVLIAIGAILVIGGGAFAGYNFLSKKKMDSDTEE